MNLSRRHFLAATGATLFAPAIAFAASPAVEVWKDPACGCCGAWVEYLRKSGFTVNVRDIGNTAMRARLGIPAKYGSCHTAVVDGYAIEGHVPLREIRRLLKERPDAIGLAVPGMVIGSPGMEQGGHVQPYEVLLLRRDGSVTTFARYPA